MTRIIRGAILPALALAVALASPAAAQGAAPPRLTPTWDARLTPPAAAPAPAARLSESAIPRPVRGVGYLLLGTGLMYVTKKAEGENGEDGVPFLPLLSGTMGALTFWYGVYEIFGGG